MKGDIANYFDSNWKEFYKLYLGNSLRSVNNGQLSSLCPFHDDHKPSLSISVADGTWFCHSCNEGGDAFDFFMKLNHVNFPQALTSIAEDFGLNNGKHAHNINTSKRTIPTNVVEKLHQSLLNNCGQLSKLKKGRGLNIQTVKRFKLGFKGDEERVCIPIFDKNGICVNIRKYSPSRGPKMLSWAKGFGEARVYPLDAREGNPISIMEGELDALLAIQDGLNSITVTGGAGTWKPSWNKLFEGKDVIICYDNDQAGSDGACKVAKSLGKDARSISIINWPEEFEEGGDYTDWRVENNLSPREFLMLPRLSSKDVVDSRSNKNAKSSNQKPLTFPEEGYIGIAADFADLYSTFLESPKSFFFMTFLTYLGLLVGDKVTLDSELKPQPRLYTVLIGESASTRKSTALKLTNSFFRGTVSDLTVQFGIGSAEGLAEEMKDNPNLILHLDELKSFVEKAKIKASVTLPMVNTLFERNEFDNRTKTSSISIRDVYLSLVAACTEDTYASMFNRSFFAIGFLNRLFLVLDRSERKQSLPKAIPEDTKRELNKRLGRLLSDIRIASEASDKGVLEMRLVPEARETFHHWYMNLEDSVFTRRLDTYAHRLMILLAISSGETKDINKNVVKRTIAIMDYELEVRRQCDPVDAENKIAAMEEKIRRTLKRGPLSKRDLMRKVHYERSGTWVFQRAIDGLKKHGDIYHDTQQDLFSLEEEI